MRTYASLLPVAAVAGLLGLSLAGCQSEPMATVAYVDMKDAALKGQIDQASSQIQTLNTQVAEAARTAQLASAKADEAGRKAAGDFQHHVLYSDDTIQFDTAKADLSQEDQTKLSAFADKIKSDNQNVYIEIQGFTDSRGSPNYNMALGEKRADAVRRYLMDQGIPLYHMSTISFGEEKPKAPNDTTEGRDMNRRAAVVVEN
jgi:outer membrane protein OmpA-like peptidoglycan-associated protein